MNLEGLRDEQTILAGLKELGYYATLDTAIAIRNAYILKQPLFIEGPPGVGKTQLAKSIQKLVDAQWFRLQCTPEMTEKKAIYEIDYQKQLLHIQLYKEQGTNLEEKSFFTREYVIERPLLQAMQQTKGSVLLVDEIDKAPEEFEYSLLEVFGEYAVSIPEIKETVQATTIPFTVITSNNTRPITETILRRCVFLYIDYPTIEEETTILRTIGKAKPYIAEGIAKVMAEIRKADTKLKQKPSISESLDWAEIIALHLEAETSDAIKEEMVNNISVVSKSKEDTTKMVKKIQSTFL